MSWNCPNCNFILEDSQIGCIVCNYRRAARLVLSSDVGCSWKTILSAEVNRRVYKRLYPDEEHQYIPREIGEYPFSVIKKDSNEWVLKVNENSPVTSTLNGNVCHDEMEYPLNEGDCICVASRSNSAIQVAPLKVSFALVEDNLRD